MKNQKWIAFILYSLLAICCLTGCGTADTPSDSAPRTENIAYAWEGIEDPAYEEAVLKNQLKLYEAFGMAYDPVKDELWYNGKLVRWFEDYYPVEGDGDGGRAGIDFWNENGVVDVYAVRDFSHLIQHSDGSYDPSGQVVALNEFSAEEFAARDIQAIKNPQISVACAGEPLTPQERQKIAAEYAAFGVTYDVDADQWFFHGEKVRYFFDVLTSNGEPLNGGSFHGVIRNWWDDDGTVDIYTVRDFGRLNEDQNGTLTAVEKYSDEEYGRHSRGDGQFYQGLEPQYYQ